jgi:hypothetical protein
LPLLQSDTTEWPAGITPPAIACATLGWGANWAAPRSSGRKPADGRLITA